jgi:hypothetical protein
MHFHLQQNAILSRPTKTFFSNDGNRRNKRKKQKKVSKTNNLILKKIGTIFVSDFLKCSFTMIVFTQLILYSLLGLDRPLLYLFTSLTSLGTLHFIFLATYNWPNKLDCNVTLRQKVSTRDKH